MEKLSRHFVFTFLIILIFAIPVTAENNPIKVFIDGQPGEVTTILENGRILVPISSIDEELGFDLEYLKEFNKVIIEKDERNIEVEIDSNKAKVDGKEIELDVKPVIKEDSIFVPLRFICESLGKEVTWDGKDQIVLVGEFAKKRKIEDTFLYFNDEYKYTLSFPNSWKEEAIIETKDGTLYVYDKKSAERFIEDGYESFGPVFEIRCNDYPATATFPYDGDYLLSYVDGKYIEAIFGRDFQFYPETLDSYNKIFNEAQEALGSFTIIEEDYSFVEDNKKNYKREIEIIHDILDNYVSNDIFYRDEILTYKKPIPDTSFLYLRVMKNEEEVLIKIESEFNENGKLIRYHLKNYGYELEENKLNEEEALKFAAEFVNRYVDENIELAKAPDLYPSLYEKDKRQSYGDKNGDCIVVIDLDHGFVEYFSYN